MYQVFAIPAFNDNYIWALLKGDRCALVDPGQADAVIRFVQNKQLTVTDILLTHHHPDHTGGVQQLVASFPQANVFAPNTDRFPCVTHVCKGGDSITLNTAIELQVMELHGHTRDHIGFLDADNAFVGDTLFSAGCGRLFEGSAEQMYHSLQTLAQLPNNPNIYCAHEYTEANLEFAKAVEKNNPELQKYADEVAQCRRQGLPTIPTKLQTQLAINPFLRPHSAEIQQNTMKKYNLSEVPSELETFAMLRKWKDNF